MAVDKIITEIQQETVGCRSVSEGREQTKSSAVLTASKSLCNNDARTTAVINQKADVMLNHEKANIDDIIEERQLESSKNVYELKEEALALKANELLLHFYSRQAKHQVYSGGSLDSLYSEDEDIFSEGESFDDNVSRKVKSQKILCHKRRRDCCRAKRDRIPVKEQLFETFCRKHETPGDIVLEKGNRKSVRVKIDRCAKQITRNFHRKDQTERRKLNIEKKLQKLGIKRRGLSMPSNNWNENPSKPEKYELHQGNAPTEMQDMLTFLIALQDREVTPEDYEFLLKLDDLVPKKTVSTKSLEKFQEENVDVSHLGEICGICMDFYKIGEIRKKLPCEHLFHKNCIEQWLQQSSTKCPLDGLEV